MLAVCRLRGQPQEAGAEPGSNTATKVGREAPAAPAGGGGRYHCGWELCVFVRRGGASPTLIQVPTWLWHNHQPHLLCCQLSCSAFCHATNTPVLSLLWVPWLADLCGPAPCCIHCNSPMQHLPPHPLVYNPHTLPQRHTNYPPPPPCACPGLLLSPPPGGSVVVTALPPCQVAAPACRVRCAPSAGAPSNSVRTAAGAGCTACARCGTQTPN